jgi:hypothetical protein
MLPAGRRAVETAKANGRWEAAYAAQSEAEVPADLAAAIAADPAAQAMFDVLTKTNRFALIYRLGAVKRPATRERKIAEFVAMLARQETPHQQKARPQRHALRVAGIAGQSEKGPKQPPLARNSPWDRTRSGAVAASTERPHRGMRRVLCASATSRRGHVQECSSRSPRCSHPNFVHCPSETTSTEPSMTVMAVCSSMA